MNVKAERIERMLQVVNRSLLLVVSGKRGEQSSMEFRKLQKVDASVFGSDRFAFEMVHFLKSSRKGKLQSQKASVDPRAEIAQQWESIFLDGLETLLVECAVVTDDIERDCFVSRIYCWFSEKLQERRDFPKSGFGNTGDNIVELKNALVGLGSGGVPTKHTLAGLDRMDQQATVAAAMSRPSTVPGTLGMGGSGSSSGPSATDGNSQPLGDPHDYDIPPIELPTYRSFSTRHNKLPVYVRHHLPNVFREGSDYTAFLPKLPDANTCAFTGQKPTTDAEKTMHELWLARRRQEAFDWKTAQHMNLLMDRLELHKSRLESDALRRQESNSYLHQRPRSPQHQPGEMGGRFAPVLRANSPKRPHGAYPNSSSILHARPLSPASPPETPTLPLEPQQQLGSEGDEAAPAVNEPVTDAPASSSDYPDQQSEPEPTASISLLTRQPGREDETEVPKLSRSAVQRAKTQRFLPMRYKLEPIESFNRNYEKNQYYMQLSDSDSEDEGGGTGSGTGTGTGTGAFTGKAPPAGGKPAAKKGGGKGAGKGGALAVKFKRDKPEIRDRPQSSRQLHDVAQNDSELRVHYRHSNYRRMPFVNPDLQGWVQDRESDREKKSVEVAEKLVEDATAGADAKGGGKGGDKGGDKGGKGGKGGKGAAAAEPPSGPPPCKYKSASQFMSIHFPEFDRNDDERHSDTHGPMRTLQLIECARVLGAMEQFGEGGRVSDKVLRAGLVIPQDAPEAVSLEGMRSSSLEGLMVNPMPKEFWRKMTMPKAAAKKKGKGKKKG